ncbi:MAG: hypothetical protein JKY98_01750 [Gammaproteobacteria bacterium]|nr:hypothetical protein [Gammaproteobacteria bacterium]
MSDIRRRVWTWLLIWICLRDRDGPVSLWSTWGNVEAVRRSKVASHPPYYYQGNQ